MKNWLNNYKTSKSNKQTDLQALSDLNSFTTINYGCIGLHVTCSRVPGPTSDKGHSQQPNAFLKNEFFHLRFSKSFKEL